MTIFIRALASYSLAWSLSQEAGPFALFEKFRDLATKIAGKQNHWLVEGVHCPICVGFWACIVLSVIPEKALTPLASHGLLLIFHSIVSRMMR